VGRGDAAAALRPTADRVRESLFNLLAHGHGDRLEDAEVLDVFAGTGALGLEALSRGAARATFLENGRAALGLLRENVAALGAEARIVARDARRPGPGTPHGLVFLDPPYGRGLGEAAMTALLAQGWVAPGALIVWEEAAPPALPDGLTPLETRAYGGTVITLAERD
jgi:16S rRNA (guanine966-N2)-methyltransferase